MSELGEKLKAAFQKRQLEETTSSVVCDYCGQQADEATGADVYPHRPDLSDLKFYVCTPCEARVGCHSETGKPLGRLANAELRQAKMDAHASFDPIWKDGYLKRNVAYGWLRRQMGLCKEDCHIGKFDLEQCSKVVELASAFHGEMGEIHWEGLKPSLELEQKILALLAKNGVWLDNNHKYHFIDEMALSHLTNSIRMLNNGRAQNRQECLDYLQAEFDRRQLTAEED